jgi:hypothetical protein
VAAAAPSIANAYPAAPTLGSQDEQELRRVWRERIQQAREARKPFERIWQSNLAFAAGQHWLVWDDIAGQLRHIQRVDPRYEDSVLYTADRINEYMQAQLGELESGDDRQQLLTAQQGDQAEQVTRELNQAVAYAWDHEWRAETALRQARQYTLTLGTSAIRCRWDASRGPGQQAAIHPDSGQVVTDPAEFQSLASAGTLTDGRLPGYKTIPEGRTIWEPYTAFQILSPPGVNHEDSFPWEILVRPILLDELRAEYGQAAAGLREDTDIASAMGLTTSQTVRDHRSQGSTSQNRLRDHAWLYTCFQRPSPAMPQGQVVVLASNDYTILDARDSLDYKLPNGDPHTGVTYLHWWRLLDRFYSRSFIEPMKDPQRAINELETTCNEIIARGGPKVFVRDGDLPQTPQGVPMEVIRMKDNSQQPNFFEGVGPGAWMDVAKARHEANLSHASTLSQVRLGENPQNVDTYSQLALINELESGKRTVIVGEHAQTVATLEELGVWDIRRFWPDQKTILVSGDEDRIGQATFRKATIPDFYMARVAKGAPQPRSQAAEIKKIDSIWAALVQCGLAVKEPEKYAAWYYDSIQAGQAQDLPEPTQDSQLKLAEFENMLMLQGEQVEPADYDLFPVHLPVHREAQDQARAAGDWAAYQRIQQHVDASLAMQQANAAKVAAAQNVPSPLGPPVPGGGQPVPGGQPPQPQYAQPDFLRLAAGN